MALSVAKLTILIGAGLAGSILAKEGGSSTVSDFVSGAFKIAFKQLKKGDSKASSSKPQNNDYLVAEVSSLRRELQMLSSSSPITIVTSSGAGGRKYGIVIVAVVVGYGYVWWKGWKLPDFMFATRGSLSEACSSIAKQLESVYSSIAATKRHFSSRFDKLDSCLDEIEGTTRQTGSDVSELREGAARMGEDVRAVRFVVETLESKINRIEGKQDLTVRGVKNLCDYAQKLEQSRETEKIQVLQSSSSRLALEAPSISPSSRAVSLPPGSPLTPSASNGSHQVQLSLHNAISASGLKDMGESSSKISNGTDVAGEETGNGYPSTGLFGFRLPGFSAPRIIRSRSAINAVPLQSHLSRQQ